MTLARRSPIQELDTVERRLRRIFDGLGIVPAPLPATDVYETDREFVFELEVPGFAEQELAVEITDHTLVIRGERVEDKEEKGKTFRLQERLAKEFERRFTLPEDADAGRISADFEQGVLTVHAPKAKAAKLHRVPIGHE